MQVCAVDPHGPQERPSGTKGTSEPWRLASAIVHIKGFAKVAGDPKKRQKRQAGAFWMELLKNKRTNKSIIISLQRRSAFSFTTEGPAPSCSFTYFFLFVQGGGKGSQPLQTAPWGWGSRVQGLGSHSPPPLSLALSPAGPASRCWLRCGRAGAPGQPVGRSPCPDQGTGSTFGHLHTQHSDGGCRDGTTRPTATAATSRDTQSFRCAPHPHSRHPGPAAGGRPTGL